MAGRVLLPGAGMLEAALAACQSLAGDAGRPAPVLTHCSIPAALQLSQVHAVLGLLISQAVKPTRPQACPPCRPRCLALPLRCPGRAAALRAGRARSC